MNPNCRLSPGGENPRSIVIASVAVSVVTLRGAVTISWIPGPESARLSITSPFSVTVNCLPGAASGK
jgi:hypothetical protein